MANSFYHHPGHNRIINTSKINNPNSIPSPRHSNDHDEVEAGSILVALASHHQPSRNDVKSMSIHNLVADSAHHKKQYSYPQPHYHRPSHDLPALRTNSLPSPPSIMLMNNEKKNEEMQYATSPVDKVHPGYAMQRPRPQMQTSHASYVAGIRSSIEQRFPSMSQETKVRYRIPPVANINTSNTAIATTSNTNTIAVVTQQQQQQQQHKQHNEFSIQYTNMKKNPKVRRNALQAYISYMTYTDIARKKMKPGAPTTPPYTTMSQQQQQHNTKRYQPYLQHHQNRLHPRYNEYHDPARSPMPVLVKHSSLPPPPRTMMPSPPTPPPPPPKPHHLEPRQNNIVVDKPLTAFLHRLPPTPTVRCPPPPQPPHAILHKP